MSLDEKQVVLETTEPSSAMVNGGEWIVVSITKMWTSRDGRRGVVDPSGGMTVAPAYDTEILLALPLVDTPKTDPPVGTIRLEDLEKRVIGPLVALNEKITSVASKKDF